MIYLNPFVPNAPFLYPLMFSGGRTMMHWERMGQDLSFESSFIQRCFKTWKCGYFLPKECLGPLEPISRLDFFENLWNVAVVVNLHIFKCFYWIFWFFLCLALFGFRTYGVHVNGYVRNDSGDVYMWIARRSKKKPTYPGKLDNTVSDENSFSQFWQHSSKCSFRCLDTSQRHLVIEDLGSCN